MGEHSTIEWTDATWPIVQGCDYESPGCINCYAVPLLWRHAHHPDPKISGQVKGLVEKTAKGNLVWTGKVALREDRLDWPLRWKAPRRIFVPSHGDLFHEAVPDEWIDRVFAVMALAPQHTFQVLTKRAERMRRYLNWGYVEARWVAAAAAYNLHDASVRTAQITVADAGFPLSNVWLMVSAEDQPRLEERLPFLLETPAAKRGVSLEPLLGPIDLCHVESDRGTLAGYYIDGIDRIEHTRLDWVIVGGESGKDARPMHPNWARDLRDQCQAAGVPFFFKQWGEWAPDAEGYRCVAVDGRNMANLEPRGLNGDGTTRISRVGKKAAGRLLDGVEWSEFPGERSCR